MATARVRVEQDFSHPVDRVFAFLTEHENLNHVFPAKISRVRDGTDGERNGVGSARMLKVGPLPGIVETNIEVVPDERVVYRITEGGPGINDHEGVMSFAPRPGGGSRLVYEIRLGSAVPGLARALAAGIARDLRKGLAKVERLA